MMIQILFKARCLVSLNNDLKISIQQSLMKQFDCYLDFQIDIENSRIQLIAQKKVFMLLGSQSGE